MGPISLLAAVVVFAAHAYDPLPRLPTNASELAVVGISSGAYMAVQLHVAFSSRFIGAGAVAGGPFYCAQLFGAASALTSCMTQPELISVAELVQITYNTELTLTIDRTKNLEHDQVYLFSGALDTHVKPGVVKKLQEYYSHFLSNESSLRTSFDVPAEHAWISTSYGKSCAYDGLPYINNCSIDVPGEMLSHIYRGTLVQPHAAGVTGEFLEFDQKAFLVAGGLGESMDDSAWIYMPARCMAGSNPVSPCKLVVALHGCLQDQSHIGSLFVKRSGLNEWADANDIVILYPQAKVSVLNPKGCWDWWGYTGTAYASKLGLQMMSIMSMVDHILGRRSSERGVDAVVSV